MFFYTSVPNLILFRLFFVGVFLFFFLPTQCPISLLFCYVFVHWKRWHFWNRLTVYSYSFSSIPPTITLADTFLSARLPTVPAASSFLSNKKVVLERHVASCYFLTIFSLQNEVAPNLGMSVTFFDAGALWSLFFMMTTYEWW